MTQEPPPATRVVIDTNVLLSILEQATPVCTGVNNPKPQFIKETILIPKRVSRRRKPRPTPSSKRTSASTPKPQPPKRKRNPPLSRQERRELGLCQCGQAVISGQTRCDKCAAKHREQNRQSSEQTRRAKGIKPRTRINAETIAQIQKEITTKEALAASATPKRVRNEAYKQKNREKQALLRANRLSLGLCANCGKPKPEDQTRCDACALKHSQYWARYTTKRRGTSKDEPA